MFVQVTNTSRLELVDSIRWIVGVFSRWREEIATSRGQIMFICRPLLRQISSVFRQNFVDYIGLGLLHWRVFTVFFHSNMHVWFLFCIVLYRMFFNFLCSTVIELLVIYTLLLFVIKRTDACLGLHVFMQFY